MIESTKVQKVENEFTDLPVWIGLALNKQRELFILGICLYKPEKEAIEEFTNIIVVRKIIASQAYLMDATKEPDVTYKHLFNFFTTKGFLEEQTRLLINTASKNLADAVEIMLRQKYNPTLVV